MNLRLSLAALLVVFGVPGWSLAAQDLAKIEKKVDIRDQGFLPQTVEIQVGERVLFANMTQIEQRVIAARTVLVRDAEGRTHERPMFDSGPIPVDRTFEWTFEHPGTYDFYSPRDPSIRGSVIVDFPQ